jgi:hypothetical protein
MEEVPQYLFKMFQLFFLLLIFSQPILMESTSMSEENAQNAKKCRDDEYLDCDGQCKKGGSIML